MVRIWKAATGRGRVPFHRPGAQIFDQDVVAGDVYEVHLRKVQPRTASLPVFVSCPVQSGNEDCEGRNEEET
jgi:hypothetical protein